MADVNISQVTNIAFKKKEKSIKQIEKTNSFDIIITMRKILFSFIIFVFALVYTGFCVCHAAEDNTLRGYNGVQIPTGSFIPVVSAQEISTAYCDEGTPVSFIATNDLYLYETDILPRETQYFGYVEKINEPVIGTNASMKIKISKLRLPDGFEMPVRGYIYTTNGNLIGGELTYPASYYSKPSFRQGFKGMVGSVPGESRRMGEHKVIASGANLMIIILSPIWITHTVTN